MFEANFAAPDSENDEVDAEETDGGMVAAGVAFSCKRKSNMVKLNNPYDEVTIARQHQNHKMSPQKSKSTVAGCATSRSSPTSLPVVWSSNKGVATFSNSLAIKQHSSSLQKN